MKWAIFSFIDDNSSEIGESSWMTGEDKETFTNDEWLFKKQVILRWPKDARLLRKLPKSTVDIAEEETQLYAAYVVKFSDNYDKLKPILEQYLKTGTTKTPDKGRGHRLVKKNARYEDSPEDENDDDEILRPLKKKPKTHNLSNNTKDIIDTMKRKHNISSEQTKSFHHNTNQLRNKKALTETSMGNENKENSYENESITMSKLKRENQELKNEVSTLKEIVQNLRGLQKLDTLINNLKQSIEAVKSLPTSTIGISPCTSSTTMFTSPRTSPLPSEVTKSSVACDDDESVGKSVVLHPGLVIDKRQKRILDTYTDAKHYTYSLMEMIWSRDVLATHSLTGKASNAFKDRSPKPCLDMEKTAVLCDLVVKRFKLADVQQVKTYIKSKLNNVVKSQKKNC